MKKNYYTILGISSNAAPDEIRSAYRKLAKEFHPDYFEGDSRFFRKIQEAYSTLGDQQKKRLYDNKIKKTSTKKNTAPKRSAPSPSYPEPEPLIPKKKNMEMPWTSPVSSVENPLESFFKPLRKESDYSEILQYKQEKNLIVEVKLSKEEAENGGDISIMIPRRVICPQCDGAGGFSFYRCRLCLGKGFVYREIPFFISIPRYSASSQSVTFSLEQFGMRNHFLTVLFQFI